MLIGRAVGEVQTPTAGTPAGGARISRAAFLRFAALGALVAATRVRSVRAGAPLQVRRNARLLNADERARFVNAVKRTKALPSLFAPNMNAYDYYVHLHLAAYYDENMPAHMAPAFGPWHRLLLLNFERDLQRTDPGVTVPYWDWTVDNTPDAYLWASDFLGGEGDPNDQWILHDGPFRAGEWELPVVDTDSLDQDGSIFALQRHFGVETSGGVPQTTLPTREDVEGALAVRVYDVAPWDDFSDPTHSFRNNLEGFRKHPDGTWAPSENHNRVHNWVGGPMTAGASPNDPVFWLHHSYIDLLYAQWQQRYDSPYLPAEGARFGQNLNDPMYRMGGVTPAMMLSHRALGYIYDWEQG